MQIDDLLRSCALMQLVYILSNQQRAISRCLESGERKVGGIRLSLPDGRPSRIAPRPVPLSRRRLFDEISVLDRVIALPLARAIAIGRNTRSKTNTRTCEDNRSRIGEEEIFNRVGHGMPVLLLMRGKLTLRLAAALD